MVARGLGLIGGCLLLAACVGGEVRTSGNDREPSCGDHHCDAVETCASCPADCGQCAGPAQVSERFFSLFLERADE